MKNKLFSILLLISFVVIILQPAIPFVQYYFNTIEDITTIDNDCDCSDNKPAKMANNGDAYLKALIKRTCPDKKKDVPKTNNAPTIVFVKTLIRDYSVNYQLPVDNFTQISDFIIQPSLSTYLDDILRPPKQA